MSRITMGIDEAGRGPALGPLVMAAVALDTKAARALTRAGLRDSKSYGSSPDAHALRTELSERVRSIAVHVAVEVVDAPMVDARVWRGELNVLEREVAARFIDRAPRVHRIIADGARMFAPLAARYEHLEAHDEAESRHASVAAASVVAKALRDQLFAAIRARYEPDYGEIRGGGYVNDGTRNFLRAYATRHGCLPPEARRSWPHPYLAGLLTERVDAPAPQLPLL